MLSPKLKQQVDSLWDMFWSGGMTNPLTSIEQITYLIFLKRLEELDTRRRGSGKPSIYGPRFKCELEHHPQDHLGIERSPEISESADYCVGHGTCRWPYLHKLSKITIGETQRVITPYDHMNGYVFPWLRVLHDTLRNLNHNTQGIETLSAPMEDAFFQFPKDKTKLFQDAIDTVDELFAGIGHVGEDDVMGDIFEYLLSEIETSGKNGQFRTPRHIIRFLIDLIKPDLGHYLIDPTAGTAGFLINDIQHLRRKYTSDEFITLEWDGAPHGTNVRDKISDKIWEQAIQGEYFVGYDNDRTMVRIGWMNMILHGIENPHILLRDTLGKSLPREESGKYDRILANPPYTGTIDKNDLYLGIGRFPSHPRKHNEPITNKTELLFTWLILDLLVAGGKAAMIVPEGILFSSSGAHKELRRQLLFHHNLEGVISLPAGVFNPYTGVKTSILVFQKGGEFTSKGKPPRTERVWFYEVTSDGYSLGAKREPDYSRNDLWDALYKWPDKIVDSTDYFQPDLYDSRWRVVDEKLIKAFPERQDFRGVEGQELRIDELFGFNDPNPKLAEKQISEQQRPLITQLYHQRLDATEARMIAENDSRSRNVRDSFEQDLRLLDRLFREVMDRMLEDKRQWKANPTFGHDVLQPIFNEISKEAREWMKECVERVSVASNIGLFAQTAYKASEIDWQSSVNTIVREFAKLDGYDIKLRTLEVKKREEPLLETKSWSAPVRLVVRNDDWRSPDGTIQGSHDEEGRVRLEYLADPALYESEQDNIIKKEYLEDCIEAKDYNLSAGRYKPFKPITVEYEPPAKLIRELQELEGQILVRLGELLDKVEGRR